MAAYPFRMLRPGPARPMRMAGAVLVLLLLAAGLLFSAGSAHHGHDAGAGERLTAADLACLPHAHTGDTPAHQHEHGDNWTAYLSPRARPASDATLVATVAVDAPALCPDLRGSHTGAAARDATLSQLGVLRV
ncbi:hypothetical protein ACWEOZ_29005 [Actinoplanes sp. NPDC004185]